MLKQKFLNFIKSFTVAKLLRWGFKGAILLWGILSIIFAPIHIYDVARSYNLRWYDFGKGDYLDPKKYIWFLVPLQFFNIFFSCYFITDVWYRKNILYIFMMLVMFLVVDNRIMNLNHHLLYATTFWR